MRISEDIVNPQLRNISILNSIIHKKRIEQLELNLSKRSATRPIWQLDPDAFICDKSFGLKEQHINKLSNLIKLAQGVKFLGDDLINLDKKLIKKYIIPLFS
ncbi:hypothetical protein A2767_00440 [Candidatus Roizmanbacteria bacterium RIFCSPHIGHO2_01_FULL_35_10]|uniref:Uncharacterized protein n=1 Tax=Candidatus Roizmanbacteria bacterium RIFCSPLOWO2_01_FULL_35_13 TaxID=1802055 RepID=A0A1F7IHG0_9BACT|nr:MAG: hypothetical protein A2767_00440 [Candidatus Roizmanbacteria bacterium RIFCSPHIGHO2_01_FULL_35_10]OGK42810.1 MAG: hypothetical protein A3A74_01205 [Candidatus Roizmanbacteria bacterium RIFCSPLOWO2_01_FULL_35_13]